MVPTAAQMPYALGITTRQNVRHSPAPSSAAASSSSLGKAEEVLPEQEGGEGGEQHRDDQTA